MAGKLDNNIALRRVNPSDDRGAVAVVVGITLIIMIGFAAIAVDAGALYTERRELQNGADAAAIAIATDCANGNFAGAEETAKFYVDANARDGFAHPEEVIIDEAAQQVTVTNRTLTPDGRDGVASWFARLLSPDFAENTVRAQATAVWQCASLAADNLGDIPVAASPCDFIGELGGGTVDLEAFDAAAAALPTAEEAQAKIANGDLGTIISLHKAAGIGDLSDACTVDPGFSTEGDEGADGPNTMPAGFGFLEDDGACGVKVLSTEPDGTFWANHKPGTSPDSAKCIRDAVGTVVKIPVFIEVNKADKTYRLYAPAAFYITGARVVGGGGGSASVPAGFSCPGGGAEWCIRGHFVKKVELDDPNGGGGGGTCFGVNTVRLTD